MSELVRVPAALVEALRALADEMEDPNAERGTMPGVRMHVRRVWAARLRTVLGAFAARAVVDAAERPDEGETPSIIDVLSEGIRNAECVCGHSREMHACTFTSVRCICGCNEFRYPPTPAAPVGEPLCVCGHKVGHHFAPRNGECRWCGCKDAQPTPAPLSSPRRTRDEGTEDEAYEAFVNWYGADVGGPTSYEMKQTFVAGFRAARLAGEDDR